MRLGGFGGCVKIGLFASTLLMIGILTCIHSCSRKPQGSGEGRFTVRLSREAYSPKNGSLLCAVSVSRPNEIDFLTIYHLASKHASGPYAGMGVAPFCFAWVPGQDAFVVTQGDRIAYFSRIVGEQPDYRGMPILCPLGWSYQRCAWSPTGLWLAVRCSDFKNPSIPARLGLYEASTKQFTITDIPYTSHSRTVWTSDTTAYVPSRDKIAQVDLTTGSPEIRKTIPLGEESYFCGIIDGKLLLKVEGSITLGKTKLVEVDELYRSRIIATSEFIFL